MSLNATPRGDRIHIALFGKRNAGKSSVINAMTNQELAIVSDVKGTTTDPVYKAMELLPLGPVVMIDTPGLDDEGELGEKRVKKAKEVLAKADIALVIMDATAGMTEFEEDMIRLIEDRKIPYLKVYNKMDLSNAQEWKEDKACFVSAKDKKGIWELKEEIGKLVPTDDDTLKIVGDLVCPNDFVILVVPIDSAAPKGRLILPQQQTIRDLLEAGAASIVVRADSQWNTLDEFISYAKDHPAEITVGNPGSGSNFYMAAKALEHEAGVQFTHVPFDGSSATITALLGGNISAASIAPGEAAANIGEGGDLKVLSLLSGNASTTFPEIPVAKDLGYNVSFQGWASFGVPLNTPEDVVKILEEGLAKAADTDTVKNVLSTKGFDYAYLNAADMTAFAKEEQAKYENIVTELELK